MKSAMEHGEVVERYLGKEQAAQRVLGPFKHSFFREVHVSPFGVIPKADPGKWTTRKQWIAKELIVVVSLKVCISFVPSNLTTMQHFDHRPPAR